MWYEDIISGDSPSVYQRKMATSCIKIRVRENLESSLTLFDKIERLEWMANDEMIVCLAVWYIFPSKLHVIISNLEF